MTPEEHLGQAIQHVERAQDATPGELLLATRYETLLQELRDTYELMTARRAAADDAEVIE